MFIQGFATTYDAFVIERFLAGICLAGVIPLANSLIAHEVPPQDRGRAFGMTGGATFLGAFLGPFGGGIINANFGLPRVFEMASLALLAAAIVVFSMIKRSTKE
jgi:MFS family permease